MKVCVVQLQHGSIILMYYFLSLGADDYGWAMAQGWRTREIVKLSTYC